MPKISTYTEGIKTQKNTAWIPEMKDYNYMLEGVKGS